MICYDMDYFPTGIDMTSSNANKALNYVENKLAQICQVFAKYLPSRENKHLL